MTTEINENKRFVRVYMKNSFRYFGYLMNEDKDFVTITNTRNGFVVRVNKSEILSLEELPENQRWNNE